mgnify:CR=1 FL=1
MERLTFTPFSGRLATAALMQAESRKDSDCSCGKWTLFDDLRLARAAFGVTDRDLTVLWAMPLGVLLGLAGTLMHQVKTSSTEHTPIGLIVALISVGAVALALRLLRSSRGALYLTSLTFGLTVFQLAQRQGGGEVLIPANDVGTIWAYGSIILCAVIILFPQIRPAAWRRSASGHR